MLEILDIDSHCSLQAISGEYPISSVYSLYTVSLGHFLSGSDPQSESGFFLIYLDLL